MHKRKIGEKPAHQLTKSRIGWLSVLVLAAACARPALPSNTAQQAEPKGSAAQQSAGSDRSLTVLPTPALARATADGVVSISDIAERVLPSVVNIALRKSTRIPNHPFWHFFGPRMPQEREERGAGSGVIVSTDGVILTNNHVVAEADEIKVTTHDGREFDADVVGTDPKSDLAVLQLKGDKSDLIPIEIGDSSRLRLGDVVLAIGNPFGVGQTVTMGIVSAKGRANVGIVDYEDFIQTDAAINPGNSGGALVNMEGKLVGINTAILSRTGGYMGVGFAIPTNMATPIMESLRAHGKVVRGWLGVSIQDIDQELASALKLPTTEGVLLSDVHKGGPAEKAGLKRGDVVTHVNGEKVDSTGRLRNLIAAAGANKTVKIDLLRNSKPLSLDVVLAEIPDASPESPSPSGGTQKPGKLDGLSLELMTPEVRKRLGIPSDAPGRVVVVGVDQSSRAAKAGLRPGDIILEINRQPVGSVEQLSSRYKRAKGPILLLIHRSGATLYLVVRG